MLTVTSVVSLVQSHVYHTQHAPLMAAHFQHIMQVPQRRLILVLYFRQKFFNSLMTNTLSNFQYIAE